jgi:BMFP domain-containing protein YqiC
MNDDLIKQAQIDHERKVLARASQPGSKFASLETRVEALETRVEALEMGEQKGLLRRMCERIFHVGRRV